MSASTKKRLRKEQAAAELTQKQQRERIEAKKLRNASITFIALMLVVALTATSILAVRGYNNSGIREKNTLAAVIGDYEINGVELNYFFVDRVSEYYTEMKNQYGSSTDLYLQMMGINPSANLDTVIVDKETGETMADSFVKEALEKAQNTYALYNKAKSENFELSEDDQETLDYTLEQLEVNALIYGYTNVNRFLRSAYGPGANIKTYTEYCKVIATANAYYNAKNDSLTFDEDDIRECDEKDPLKFNNYTFAAYYVNYAQYIEGGTKDEDGNVTYSDAEKEKALKRAEMIAKVLAASTDVEALDEAIKNLEVNKNTEKVSTKNTNYSYDYIPEEYREWLTDPSRKENDITMAPYYTVTIGDDGEEVSELTGYHVVAFQSMNDNRRPLANVRHLLVRFEGGSFDASGYVTYSDAEKAAAKAKAEKLLQTWKDGLTGKESFEEIEKSFSALVKEHTGDDASKETGGLYEDIYFGASYVENFLNWSVDESRKPGDTGVVEGTSGYHIMFYSSDDEVTNRDRMIKEHLRTTTLEAWFQEVCDTITLEAKNTSNVYASFPLNSYYS